MDLLSYMMAFGLAAAGAGSRAALILFYWDAFIILSILNSQ